MKKCQTAIEDKLECTNCCVFCEKLETCEDACDSSEFGENCKCIVDTELMDINKMVPEAIEAITKITLQKKEIEETEKLMKEKILVAMEKAGIKKFENDKVRFTYTAPTTRTTLDSKGNKDAYPEIYEKYTNTSNVKASVRITVK